MLPLKDDNPTSRFAWMTALVVAANAALFAYELSLASQGLLEPFLATWSFVPNRFFADPFALGQIATIFSAMFLHASLLHIGGNMLYLWIFGNNVEDRLGPVRFLGFYLICGVVATLGNGLVAPGANALNLGASGAIAGVLAAYLLLYPRARVLTVVIIELVRIPAFVVIGLWFVLQLANGVLSISQSASAGGGVAYFAHVWGFAAGLVLTLPLLIADRTRKARFVGWR